MIYDEADKQTRAMNRKILHAFDRLKLMNFDEVNVIREVRQTYEGLMQEAKRRYLTVARTAYCNALMEAGYPEREAKRRSLHDIDEALLLAWLEETDPVLFYQLFPEVKRREERLSEALEVTPTPTDEIGRAMRALAFTLGQISITVTDRATIEAFRTAGIAMVMWNAETDRRVCPTCRDLDGRIFRLGKAPDKPHPNCRCWLSVIRRK